MNMFFNKFRKLFIQIGIPIVILTFPIFIPDEWIDSIKKISDSVLGTSFNSEITNAIVKGIIIIFLYIKILALNSRKEFLNGDVYGNVPMIFYYVARILGYQKITLIRKPYDIQFKILKNDLFEILDDGIEKDEDVDVIVNTDNFNNSNNLRECNLIIEDTYPIKSEQIPQAKRDLDTIWIKREVSSKAPRVYSTKLINAVSENVAIIQKTGAKINLFLTTNTKNTERIVKDIFMKGERSKYCLELYLQNADGLRSFKEKGIKI